MIRSVSRFRLGREHMVTHEGGQGESSGRPAGDDLGDLREFQDSSSYYHSESKTYTDRRARSWVQYLGGVQVEREQGGTYPWIVHV